MIREDAVTYYIVLVRGGGCFFLLADFSLKKNKQTMMIRRISGDPCAMRIHYCGRILETFQQREIQYTDCNSAIIIIMCYWIQWQQQ